MSDDLSVVAHRQSIADQLATDLSAIAHRQGIADLLAASSISGGVIVSQEEINEKRITKLEQRLDKLEEAMYKNNTLHGKPATTSQQIESAEEAFDNLSGVL